eukprot:SAG11_NODE_1475_length_4838_cov_3.412956_3_plen_101_part_00
MNMTSLRTKQVSNFNYKLLPKQTATESVGYFVLEHQPQRCNELPPNGLVRWSNIAVEVNGKSVGSAVWTAKQESPACNSTTTVHGSTVEIHWDPEGQPHE